MPSVSSFTSIPEIDISPLYGTNSSAKTRVAHQLGTAATEVGFMYVAGTGMSDEVFDRMHEASKAFFAQSLEAKMSVFIGNSAIHRGYAPLGTEVHAEGVVTANEFYDLSWHEPEHLGNTPLSGPNPWPKVPNFASAVMDYFESVVAVGREIMRAFTLYLSEPEDTFDRISTNSISDMRLLHYPPTDGIESAHLGTDAHTDYELITLLEATGPGLEVLNGNGQWIDAPPRPGRFVVNIGDLLEIWTNGLFVATTHRVRSIADDRYSYPVFINVDYDALIEPLSKLQIPGQPSRAGVRAGDHMCSRLTQTYTYMGEFA